MQYKEYMDLFNGLNSKRDLERFKEQGYDERLLETLVTQKFSRMAMKNNHRVKGKEGVLLSRWNNGASFMEIGRRFEYPAFLCMMIILKERGVDKKHFWDLVKDPDRIKDKRVRKEMMEVLDDDMVYGPEALEKQKARGEWGEENLHMWLDGQGIEYYTEDDLRERGESTKTPDCLLKTPMMYQGHKIFWVESKAAFGDNKEFRTNSKKQLIPYTELFGPGVVVYWTGHLDDLEPVEDVYVEDIGILEKKLRPVEE